ncbi:MFS transporter [Corynebacterium diphtheriae]|uniref:MFS transporter n=1 Tax=Corynebacterium diphtheriae TaxID=1717 RepID=UPI0002468A92|nr:MFS transporter [Corynebacterium diphtheriae]AEX79415.1 permease of the major facilitator superfamily [Corynebacterium diphtheriae HC03]AEX81673.1 permease of the major facilitator superfamily [Corynebacterium diphtheriae HC04]AEX83915.1 permease of the major facilitator superfamily [Corynebacterium diphtheriae VA01]KJJ60325.1 MFS transporter permease [Corynebacterium diphtheriae]CAB0520174.1 MFS transporter [Corynebacterium diphtheriae]
MRSPTSNQLAWSILTVLTRLVVTTLPMVAVVGTAAVGKSYVAGGFISGGYAAGEAAGAIFLTHRLAQTSIKRQLRTICWASAVLLIAAGSILWLLPDLWVFSAVSILVLGFISSPIPGVLRSSATQCSTSSQRILAADNVINQTCWVLGPIIGVVIVHRLNTLISYASLALLMLLSSVLLSVAIPSSYRHQAGEEGRVDFRPIAVPIVASGVIMAVTAAFDTLTPSLLNQWFGSDEKTSFVLALLAFGSVLASAVFGIKKKWSRPKTLAMVSTLFMIALLGIVGSLPSYFSLLAIAALIGVVQAPSMVLRQVIVSNSVSDKRKAAAFSFLYAAGGVGYSVSAAVTPWSAQAFSAQSASVIIAALCIAALWGAARIQRSSDKDDAL